MQMQPAGVNGPTYVPEVMVRDSVGWLTVGNLDDHTTIESALEQAWSLAQYRTLGDLVDAGLIALFDRDPSWPLVGVNVQRYHGRGLDLDESHTPVLITFDAGRGDLASDLIVAPTAVRTDGVRADCTINQIPRST